MSPDTLNQDAWVWDALEASWEEGFSYLTAINSGPGDATGVTLTDRLPTGVTFVSASDSAAQSVKAVPTDFSRRPFDGRAAVISVTISAELGDLASGEEAALTITVKADSVGDLTNNAEVTANEPVCLVGHLHLLQLKELRVRIGRLAGRG